VGGARLFRQQRPAPAGRGAGYADARRLRPGRAAVSGRRCMTMGLRDRRGMALLTVLLLVAVMAALCVVLLDDVRFSVRRTTNAEGQAQVKGFAAGVEAVARGWLSALVRADPARTPLQPQWNGRVFALPLEEGEGRAVIRDGQACFNLNSLVL